VRDDQLVDVWAAAEQRFGELVDAGAPPNQETAQHALGAVGAERALSNHGVKLEPDWRGELVPKMPRFSDEDFRRRGGYVSDPRDINVTGKFFGKGKS